MGVRQLRLPNLIGVYRSITGNQTATENDMFQDVMGPKPQPATVAPPETTADTSERGNSIRYARENHTHPTRVQRKSTTLDANGVGVWMFTTPFDAEPNIPMPSYRELANNMPIMVRVKDFYREKNSAGVVVAGGVLESAGGTGKYTGVQYQAARLQNTGSLVNLTLTLNITGTTNLAGIKIYCQAAPNTP